MTFGALQSAARARYLLYRSIPALVDEALRGQVAGAYGATPELRISPDREY